MNRLQSSTVALILAVAGCGGGGGTGSSDGAVSTADLAMAMGDGPPPAGADLAAATEVLSNVAGKVCDDFVAPDKGEERHWAAARLTPSKAPFEVTAIRYRLVHGSLPMEMINCKADLAHAIEVYVVAATAPPASPMAAARIDVPAGGTPMGKERMVEHKLAQPVMLGAGQHLFVALQYAGTSPDVLCVTSCGPGTADRNYWSNAEKAPFKWATLASLGLQTSLHVEAVGTAK